MNEILATFIQESRDQLAAMEANLLYLEQGNDDPEILNSIFRAAHTIKGAAGIVELEIIEDFTHVLENVLDRLSRNQIAISDSLISVLLAACDHLNALLDRVASGTTEPDEELLKARDNITQRLRDCMDNPDGALVTPSSNTPEERVSKIETEGMAETIHDCWHISVRFGKNILRNGIDPAAILRYLLSLGEITHITTLIDTMPLPAEMDPESCYLGCEISFRSQANKETIARVFDFVRDDCILYILPPHSKISDYIRLINELPEEPLRLGEILVRSGALTWEELLAGLARQNEEACDATRNKKSLPESETSTSRIGEILVEDNVVQPEIVEAAIVRQKQILDKKADEARLIRVHASKLDHLIDLVGELVIIGASANLLAQKSKLGHLVEATSMLTRLVEDIRDSALQLRMVQIGDTFNRFHRVVRDTAKNLGKEIELVVNGGETELDKSLVEKIGDPLMHLVRNAMDHGIETTAIRQSCGKPSVGRIALNAYHDSGNIVIEVADDGGGLPRDKIRAKAIERGLITPTQIIGERELNELIFEAGFSTADKVTNLSGRGVGMDVVRRNILALRGNIDVESLEGQGTRFIIRLPLTLAIIDGFLVSSDKAAYVIPLEAVVECLELTESASGRNYLNLRDEALPFVRLRELFEIGGSQPRRESVVVVRSGMQKIGIVVDMLHGEFQTVIKPLGAIFRHLRGIAGSTVLGSGEVALILDVPMLAHLASSAEESARSILSNTYS